MASYENNDISLGEMDLEVFEIDGALLRELLEEQEVKDDNDQGNIEGVVESLEETNIDHNTMNREQERRKENCLEQYQCHSTHEFEWMSMMEHTNPLNEVIMNWFSDDIVEMVDFGYANGECYSQIYDGLVSNEASYGCLWEDCNI